ncbi:MAG: hypothetical protein K2P92_08010, partial [Bdellovibrionaceae bacterium]|nr:hypothetical protein [Pseudobdellovibrionaceae bacterium]
ISAVQSLTDFNDQLGLVFEVFHSPRHTTSPETMATPFRAQSCCKSGDGCYITGMAQLIRSTLILIAGLVLTNPQAYACSLVPLEKNTSLYILNLIKNTPDIYLAEATSFSKEDETFTFKVTETIRGEKKPEITLGGQPTSSLTNPKDLAAATSDFGAHKEGAFWNQILFGRAPLGADCHLAPAFQVGQTYLILYKQPYQTKSFELIKSKQDRWYQYVYETFYPSKKKKFKAKK